MMFSFHMYQTLKITGLFPQGKNKLIAAKLNLPGLEVRRYNDQNTETFAGEYHGAQLYYRRHFIWWPVEQNGRG
jgi:hypothetical protein